MSLSDGNDWTKPQAMAIPKEGYFQLEQGKYGPVFPRTPACHGFTIIAKIKPGREQVIREYGKTLEKALEADPSVLAPLKLQIHLLEGFRLAIDCGRSATAVRRGTGAAVASAKLSDAPEDKDN